MMRQLFIIFTITILFMGCKMSKPNIKTDYGDMSKIEKVLAYEVDRCRYAQQYTTTDLRCDKITTENRKITYILRFNLLSKNKQLPKLYRKSGADEMTFDDYFKYMK